MAAAAVDVNKVDTYRGTQSKCINDFEINYFFGCCCLHIKSSFLPGFISTLSVRLDSFS